MTRRFIAGMSALDQLATQGPPEALNIVVAERAISPFQILRCHALLSWLSL
jgi:hypothetical protein